VLSACIVLASSARAGENITAAMVTITVAEYGDFTIKSPFASIYNFPANTKAQVLLSFSF
jgi:hypothetical protein